MFTNSVLEDKVIASFQGITGLLSWYQFTQIVLRMLPMSPNVCYLCVRSIHLTEVRQEREGVPEAEVGEAALKVH